MTCLSCSTLAWRKPHGRRAGAPRFTNRGTAVRRAAGAGPDSDQPPHAADSPRSRARPPAVARAAAPPVTVSPDGGRGGRGRGRSLPARSSRHSPGGGSGGAGPRVSPARRDSGDDVRRPPEGDPAPRQLLDSLVLGCRGSVRPIRRPLTGGRRPRGVGPVRRTRRAGGPPGARAAEDREIPSIRSSPGPSPSPPPSVPVTIRLRGGAAGERHAALRRTPLDREACVPGVRCTRHGQVPGGASL